MNSIHYDAYWVTPIPLNMGWIHWEYNKEVNLYIYVDANKVEGTNVVGRSFVWFM